VKELVGHKEKKIKIGQGMNFLFFLKRVGTLSILQFKKKIENQTRRV
jgi:hypothetical protein